MQGLVSSVLILHFRLWLKFWLFSMLPFRSECFLIVPALFKVIRLLGYAGATILGALDFKNDALKLDLERSFSERFSIEDLSISDFCSGDVLSMEPCKDEYFEGVEDLSLS